MESLKEKKLWLCWKYITTEDGKKTKVPYGINGMQTGTSKKYEKSWATYEEAKAAAMKHNFHGVGFIIPKGYYFLDIDNKDLTNPMVQEILSSMDSYGETSPSGKGLHILGKCDFSKLPLDKGRLSKEFYCKNPHNSLELYIGGATNRYATFTGNVISDKPLTDKTTEILTFLNKHMKKSLFTKTYDKSSKFTSRTFKGTNKFSTTKENNLNFSHTIEPMDDLTLLSTARTAKNGEKFSLLYDKGDFSAFESHSNADASLCSMLAFYTGDDKERIDKLFRASALYREKWEREDYRTLTIEKAIALCDGNFHYSLNPRPTYIYYDEKSKRERICCPLLAKYIRENLHYFFILDHAKNEVIRYVYENGCYSLYSDEMLKGVIKSYITSYNEILLKMSDVEEVFRQITTDLAFLKNDDINADENIINFQNGILYLSDMTLRPHSPEILSTIQIPCNWNEDEVDTPIFDKFIKSLTCDDTDIENLLLEFIGVCLSNVKGWRLKKSLFMVGPGNTGKSVLKKLTEKLLGVENYIGIDLSELEARFGTSNLFGKRLAGSSDMSFSIIGELKNFKKSTGGDNLFSEYKRENGFGFTYNGLIWFCTNRLPKFGGDNGEWIYDRILLVECNNVIPPEDQDKNLIDSLYTEKQGIIVKAIHALNRVIKNGFKLTEPDSALLARRRYMIENNPISCYIEECLVLRPDRKITDNVTTGYIYKHFKDWCMDNSRGYIPTPKEFREGIADYFNTTFAEMTVRRGNGGTFYRDYTIEEEAKNQYGPEKIYSYK